MQYKMTEEFASAMVTVIPIILLVAAVEYSSLTRAADQAADQEIERWRELLRTVRDGDRLREFLRAVSDGTDQTFSDRPRAGQPSWWLHMFWYVLALSHVGVEVNLIDWLAHTERGPHPLTAQFVVWVAYFGFVGILLQPLIQHSYLERARRRKREAISAEITAELQGQLAEAEPSAD